MVSSCLYYSCFKFCPFFSPPLMLHNYTINEFQPFLKAVHFIKAMKWGLQLMPYRTILRFQKEAFSDWIFFFLS